MKIVKIASSLLVAAIVLTACDGSEEQSQFAPTPTGQGVHTAPPSPTAPALDIPEDVLKDMSIKNEFLDREEFFGIQPHSIGVEPGVVVEGFEDLETPLRYLLAHQYRAATFMDAYSPSDPTLDPVLVDSQIKGLDFMLSESFKEGFLRDRTATELTLVEQEEYLNNIALSPYYTPASISVNGEELSIEPATPWQHQLDEVSVAGVVPTSDGDGLLVGFEKYYLIPVVGETHIEVSYRVTAVVVETIIPGEWKIISYIPTLVNYKKVVV